MITPLLLPFLAILLGFKHSYDPDHILMVSNLLTKTRSTKNTVKITISWAAGHTFTASTITILLYQLRETFLSAMLNSFEFAVVIMLILLGFLSLKKTGRFHIHKHGHDGEDHSHPHFHLESRKDHDHKSGDHYHKHMFGIGVLQGLASNDELLLLLTVSLSLTSIYGILLGVAIFGVGVALGMVVFGMVLNYPLIRFGTKSIREVANVVAGTASIGYGVYLAFAFLVPI